MRADAPGAEGGVLAVSSGRALAGVSEGLARSLSAVVGEEQALRRAQRLVLSVAIRRGAEAPAAGLAVRVRAAAAVAVVVVVAVSNARGALWRIRLAGRPGSRTALTCPSTGPIAPDTGGRPCRRRSRAVRVAPPCPATA
jgi:hypothetical protein